MSPFPKAKFWFISVPFFSDRAFLLERAWSFGGWARASRMLVQRHEPSTRRCKLLLLRSLSHLGILPLGHLPQPNVTRENYMKWCRSFHFVISLKWDFSSQYSTPPESSQPFFGNVASTWIQVHVHKAVNFLPAISNLRKHLFTAKRASPFFPITEGRLSQT